MSLKPPYSLSFLNNPARERFSSQSALQASSSTWQLFSRINRASGEADSMDFRQSV
ncbi:hypothetical protein [Geomonas oryzae]|uniref:hypothetical protein n=1 Tax=Geomonas oryzae TaxID=2364273 RepID=UPI0013A5E35E|nr:hypothetical protein [Geomonas oryzae]